MFATRTYNPIRHTRSTHVRKAFDFTPPHTYGVRVGLCAAFATEPCRPTACIPAAPFRHTPCRFRSRQTTAVWRNRHTAYRFRPRQTATVWRNLPQHPRSGETYTFSAKEKDSETGLSYFGARYYSSDLSIWLSVDPMSDKYPSLSPYVYCANNPVKLVDPNGEEVGDFFDENGIFLGSDGKDDGKIYIISQDIWDRYVECDENDNLTGVLADPEYRDLYTKKPSQAYLSNEAVFSILSFYNSTGFELTRNDNLGSGVLLRTRVEGHTGMNDYTVLELANPKEWITISQNHPDTYLDNYFDIKSAYDNERGHIKQFLSIGGDAYSAQTDSQRENYALDHQQSQPMYKKTSNYFKDQTENYKLQNRQTTMKRVLIYLGLLVLCMSLRAQNSFFVKDAYCIDMELGRVKEDTNMFYMDDCFPNVCHRYFYFTVVIDLSYSNDNAGNGYSSSIDLNQEKEKYVADSVFFICFANQPDTLFLNLCYFSQDESLLTVELYSLFPDHLLPYDRKELIKDVMKNYSTLKNILNNSLALIYHSPVTKEFYTLLTPGIKIPVYEDEKNMFNSYCK